MHKVPFVTESEAAAAREMELRLMSLPSYAGILFVSVEVRPSIEEGPLFHLMIGGDRRFKEDTLYNLVQAQLKDELEGKQWQIVVRRGIAR